MTTGILFRQLTSVSLHDFRAYLECTGWMQNGTIPNVASIWHRSEQSDDGAEILLPESQIVRDYWDGLLDAVVKLARFERKATEQMVQELSTFFCDQVSIRVIADDVEGGTIPLVDGVKLNEKGRDLMVAAVLSTVSKRRNFSGTRPAEATVYLSGLRLGQTEIGSYVVNIITPVARRQEAQRELEDTPFGRVVTTNLALGLHALCSAVRTYDDNPSRSELDDAVAKGASANMCDALIGLSGEHQQRAFSISLSLSKDVQYGGDVPRLFDFRVEDVRTLREMANYYRDNYVRTGFTAEGFVKKLDRDPASDIGFITITADVNGFEKNIEFELAEEQYKVAIRAHEDRKLVTCKGDLHVSPRRAKLLNSSGFRVIGSSETFLKE